jgi:2-polyprenyl-3-methyl-5-hydroxy-6-metoxy-1,4-benzoquinol methylase
MNKPDYRNTVYNHYLERPQSDTARGYTPHALPAELGEAWYGAALAGIAKDATVFEVGAGEGHFLAYVKSLGYTRVYGVDLCQPMVEHAQGHGHDVRLENAINHLAGVADETFGAIVAIDIVEHLTVQEIIDLLAHAHRVLQPGGVLIVKTVNGQGLFTGQVMYGDATHVTMLNPGSLGQLLAMAGFGEPMFRESSFFGRGKKSFVRRLLWSLIKRIANLCRWADTGKTQDIWSENMICWTRK